MMQSAIRNQSAIRHPQSEINPQSAIRNPKLIRNPQSEIRNAAQHDHYFAPGMVQPIT
jgi:hypothetical protein